MEIFLIGIIFKIRSTFILFTDLIFNWMILKKEKVKYRSYPRIFGRVIISNNGEIIFGNINVFNSSISSNYVGLFKHCTIGVQQGAKRIIGDNCGFSGVSIYCANKITIGKYVNLGGNVCVWDTDFHPLEYQARRIHNVTNIKSVPIIIGDDVFVGANSIILKGVIIGNRAIIGAGSIVAKNIPEDEIWAGNPARFIRKINNAQIENLKS